MDDRFFGSMTAQVQGFQRLDVRHSVNDSRQMLAIDSVHAITVYVARVVKSISVRPNRTYAVALGI